MAYVHSTKLYFSHTAGLVHRTLENAFQFTVNLILSVLVNNWNLNYCIIEGLTLNIG